MRTNANDFQNLLVASLFLGLCSLGLAACGPGGGGNGDGDGSSTNAKLCGKTCSKAADCAGMNTDAEDWKCTDGLCEADMCSKDAECVPSFSGWSDEGCKSGDCSGGQVCIKHAGSTYCASKPAQGSCTVGMKLTKTKQDDSGDVDVCGKSNVSCSEGTCTENDGGGDGGCDKDDDCTGDLKCMDGECKCEKDADCPGTSGLDKCYSGDCGCKDDSSCSMLGSNYKCVQP